MRNPIDKDNLTTTLCNYRATNLQLLEGGWLKCIHKYMCKVPIIYRLVGCCVGGFWRMEIDGHCHAIGHNSHPSLLPGKGVLLQRLHVLLLLYNC